MEKPKFTFTPQGAKVPFILSEEGESPVIQVRKQLIEIYLWCIKQATKNKQKETHQIHNVVRVISIKMCLIWFPFSMSYGRV